MVLHLTRYIKEYGEKGGGDKVVIAYAKIGKTLWDSACPVKTVNGACIKITRERAVAGKQTKRRKGSDLPTQCGESSKIKVVSVARDEKKVTQAVDALNKAVADFERKNGKTGGDEGAALYYYAQAKFLLADRDYEAYVAIKFPTGLDFDPNNKAKADKSRKRFDDWAATKAKAGQVARTKYEAIIGYKEAANAIAAAARIGQIQQNFSDQLFTAEIPNDVRTGEFAEDKVDAYCDELTDKAIPLQDKSTEAFSACLGVSTRLGWFSDWSKLCENELGQIQPDKFPTALELRASPDEVAPITDVEAAAIKLDK